MSSPKVDVPRRMSPGVACIPYQVPGQMRRPISDPQAARKYSRARTCGSWWRSFACWTAPAGTPARWRACIASCLERSRVHALIASSMRRSANVRGGCGAARRRRDPDGRSPRTTVATARRSRPPPRPRRRRLGTDRHPGDSPDMTIARAVPVHARFGGAEDLDQSCEGGALVL